MSVPKSERRQSEVEYIVILQQLEEFFINQNVSENRVPALSDELVKLSMEAYNCATMFFELCNGRIVGTIAQKKKYCKKTYYTARELASQINIMIAFRMRANKPTAGLVQKTEDILKVCELMLGHLNKLNRTTEENNIDCEVI